MCINIIYKYIKLSHKYMQQEQHTIGTALSVISYLRCFFSEDSFESKPINGIDIKILKNTPETARMFQWIHSLDSYRDRIYKISIGIYSLIDNKLIEMYSIHPNGELDIKGICRYLQKMEILRGKYVIKLKVFTSSFIEIKGFKRSSETWEIENLVEMEYGGMKIYYKNENITPVKNDLSIDSNIKTNIIKCSCIINSNEKEMLQCIKCLCWVHASCHGYFSSKDRRIKKEFICYSCTGIVSKELTDCCIYRRILTVLYNEEIGIVKKAELMLLLVKRFDFSLKFMGILVQKLISDGFIKQNKGMMEVIKNGEVKEKIKGYFNGRRMECLIAMNEIKCEINYKQ